MFGIKQHGFWEGADEPGVTEKLLKSWAPLFIKSGVKSLVETMTGKEVGRFYTGYCSDKTAEAINRQIRAMHPDVEYAEETEIRM